MVGILQCPRCRGGLEHKDQMLCCRCGFSFRLHNGVHEIEAENAPVATDYDEEYYSSPCYDCSEDRISGVVWLARVQPGDRVLDLGCGPGAIAVSCALMGAHVYGADPSRSALRLSEKRARTSGVSLELFEFDGRALPFRDSSFNSIIMADVAEHVDDSSLGCLFMECHRLLVPGGRLVLHTAPSLEAMRICSSLRRLTLGAIDFQAALITPEYEHLHVRYHSRKSIESLLRRSGLSPVVWGEVKYLKDRWPRQVRRSLGRLLSDQIWALAFKGPIPSPTFQEAPYLDAVDVPSDLDMGSCSEWILGSGFYPSEEGAFRWTDREALLYLRSNEGCSRFTMRISAPHPDIERRPVRLKVFLDGKKEATLNLTDPRRQTISIDLQRTIRPGLHKARLEVDRTFTPRDLQINQDSRSLGIMIYGLGLG